MIRSVKLSDAQEIADIYNYYIKDTIITFEEQKVTAVDITKRIEKVLEKGYPYIVYEENNYIIGYAYVNNWRERSAYDITLETSIYLKNDEIGKGFGSSLLLALIKESEKINTHSLIGVISLPNKESQKLHKKFGFHRVGFFKESGKKFNKLIDVEFWQLILK